MEATARPQLVGARATGFRGAKVAARARAVAALPRGNAPMTVAQTVVIGLAADSGCGKSTFMRRMTNIFGGVPKAPAGGNPDSNTLISDMTTVICLDDYHADDRNGRKVKAITALDSKAP